MCGLAGELRFDHQPADLAAVERITHELAPRGPDAWGFHSQGPIALGHRRLKIMDLSDGSAQPMIDNHLGLSLAFNGAIYNFPELRAELENLGYAFHSGGDTEVLLKGYHAWGKDMLPKLNGMFAFAIWERDSKRLFIARDRLGVKPLYLSKTDKRLRFASSLPALLKGGDISGLLDPVALNHYLNFHAVVPAPRTLLAGVEKLPPASWLMIDADGKSEQQVWWTLPYGPHEDERNLSFEDWRGRVLDSTREAVAIRQRAAVDVGVLLSGGVDSSMLVGLLREVGAENLSTFSIGFEDAGGERGDEFQYSDLIAKHYGTRHHQLRIQESEIIEQLPAAFRAMSEPMVSHDCIAFYLLSREVAKHCKVVQSGQGADELFAGYHWYPQVDGASDPVAAYRAAFVDRSYEEYAATVQPKWLLDHDAAGDFVRDHFAQPGADAAVDKALRLDSTVMLVDDPVKRVDNMTMAWGLEARTPFLDYRLVELSARVPARFKLPNGGKHVLKEAARLVIPAEVIDRKKGYFPVPGLKHLEGNTLNWVRELLLDPSQDRGLFNPSIVDTLLTNPKDQLTPLRGSKLWQLAALNLWLSEQGL
ncbi:N-acetylglutaminylglutamine amidotransferase [Pseudomonas syringae]|nr:N-acetylglutaminylglutamine amidotransferase [Pseudomonas syringae]MBD8575767.1 N-acetylglutaminylglutamine amidotransferase [Pseudomonas syringae]MBD8791176.1 N-acetylglutaminylglutamine amidotransferase [Pseudomonas syringae]MBD8802270.1 N-acetylglutaminylglutamine amidotransferase [Pseudomonas syringae]MBD8812905.1 N-acetylglutaminylglutamine amidotransferase [Pseudomonas syringae]